MARSPNCLTCKWCRILGYCDRGGTKKRDWRTQYSCDRFLLTGQREYKGEDKDNCLLYEPKKKGVKYDD